MANFCPTENICNLELAVLKLFKNIFNFIVWAVVSLYLMVFFIFSIPAVQTYLGQRASQVLSKKLGTSVSIGSVRIGLPSSLTLLEVNVKDQQGADMLSAGRLSTRIELTPLVEGKISIATAQLFGLKARLYQEHADSKTNFQFVIDSLSSKDTTTTSTLNLRVNSLIMRHANVSFHCLDAPETPGLLNMRHLQLSDISTHLVLKTLTEDSLNVNVKRLSFAEQSGLRVQRLRLRFEGGLHGADLADVSLRMAGTDIQLGDLTARYHIDNRQLDISTLKYAGSIKPSMIQLSDASPLLPALKNLKSTVTLASDFTGVGDTLHISTLQVGSTDNAVNIDLSGHIGGFTQEAKSWDVDAKEVSLSAKMTRMITEALREQHVQVPEEIARVGGIHLTGAAHGQSLQEVYSHCRLNTDAGQAEMGFSLDKRNCFQGVIKATDINLHQLTNNHQFGRFSSSVDIRGILPPKGEPTVDVDATVQHFEYLGYPYQNIKIAGTYHGSDIHGSMSVDDAHLNLDANGQMMTRNQQKAIHLQAAVKHFSPQAVNLSEQWGNTSFSGKLLADMTGSGVNDAVGNISVTDFSMLSPTVQYILNRIDIESGFDADRHYMSMRSDFGEARIKGIFDYQTLAQSFTNLIAAQLPTLPGLPAVNPHTKNNFTVEANIRKSDWLQYVFQVPVKLGSPFSMHGYINDASRQLELECDLPQFSYQTHRFESGHVTIQSPSDSLTYHVEIAKLAEDDDSRLSLRASGSAHNNMLATSILWDNHAEQRMSGHINTQASFNTALDGKQSANIHIAPSTIILNNNEWSIDPSYLTYSERQLDVSNFRIHHERQFLSLQGTASDHPQDSLSVQMKDIDVRSVLDLVDFHAVDFDGQATGGGMLREVFGDLQAEGALTVEHFKFENGRMGTLDAHVNWNKDEEQIDIHALADDGADAQTHIEGFVSPKRNEIDLSIQAEGTHIDFARSFTESFISTLVGHCDGTVRLAGPLDAINLTGQVVVNGRAHISTLNCIYELRNDTLDFVPNDIKLRRCLIYDVYGNEATLTGGVHHQELTNLTFDIDVETEKLLAYDFRDFGDDTFYGTVFADGHVAIKGREHGVSIDADVTPLSGSSFVYNAASPDAINDQQFIEWGPAPAPSRTGGEEDRSPGGYRSDLTLRLKINATPDATIRILMDAQTNDYITLHGQGELQTSYYNKGGFNMFGTYRITEGTYALTIQNIIHKNFIFREGGTVVFNGDPYDAALNLQAQYTVNGVSLSDLNVGKSFSNTVRVNCLMNITGQPRQPLIDFDFEMPTVNSDEQQMVRSLINSEEELNQQVVYLLAVGRFYPQGANNSAEAEDAASPSKTSLAMQSLLSGTLSGQINSLLGQVIKSNNWNFGANISTGDEGWNNAEYEGLISGRLLNNRLLINGQFGYRDNATTATPTFIGDFDIRYLLYPNGNLALKVYNQSNERYFTKSSLNTQGIGIIMKKDFNSLSDLFGTKRK